MSVTLPRAYADDYTRPIALIFHHTGCAVLDIDAALHSYTALGLVERTRVFDVTSQDVKVVFVHVAPGVYIELIQGSSASSPVDRYVGAGFYHLCFLVENLDATVKDLSTRGFSPLRKFESEAFDGNTCRFVVTPENHLIELAEMAPTDFASFFAASRDRAGSY